MSAMSEFIEYVGSPAVGATGTVLITDCFALRLVAEHDALTARVAQLEACLTDVKEQLEMEH